MENKKDDYPPTNPLAWALGAVAVASMVAISFVAKKALHPKKKK